MQLSAASGSTAARLFFYRPLPVFPLALTGWKDIKMQLKIIISKSAVG
jgi:hypothetical protein